MPAIEEPPIILIGHPFATIGMGEQLRSHIHACRSVDLPFKVIDIFRYASRSDPSHSSLMATYEVTSLPRGGIRIFHINGDEIETVLKTLDAQGNVFSDGYNVIVPAWELPVYPKEWVKGLRRFNEVWALSHFIANALAAVGVRSTYIGQPLEVPLGYFLPRRYFGIRESAFVLLHFFDLSSYAGRKNPMAILAMFEAIRKRRPFADIQLVLKVKNGDQGAEDWLESIRSRLPEAVYLGQPMNALETRSLINCCDCFASLHRAEGFGRGAGEAMFLGRVALATAWSGNLDYMTPENSLLVKYRLIPVGPGEYPFGEHQVWAEPDIADAVDQLESLIANPDVARATASRGRQDVRLGYGFRAIGLRILGRTTEILESLNRQ